MMVASSFYMAMLLTDWSSSPADVNGVPVAGDTTTHEQSTGSFVIKVGGRT